VLRVGLARIISHHHRARGRTAARLRELSRVSGVRGRLSEVRLSQRLNLRTELLAKSGGVRCASVQLRLMRRLELLQRALLPPLAFVEFRLQPEAGVAQPYGRPSL
jgi:hypothetical protein